MFSFVLLCKSSLVCSTLLTCHTSSLNIIFFIFYRFKSPRQTSTANWSFARVFTCSFIIIADVPCLDD